MQLILSMSFHLCSILTITGVTATIFTRGAISENKDFVIHRRQRHVSRLSEGVLMSTSVKRLILFIMIWVTDGLPH
jgi:hypothetical protein